MIAKKIAAITAAVILASVIGSTNVFAADSIEAIETQSVEKSATFKFYATLQEDEVGETQYTYPTT